MSAATLANSSFALEVGKPNGRVQLVVLSTYSTVIVLAPVVMVLINWLETYLHILVNWRMNGESSGEDGLIKLGKENIERIYGVQGPDDE